MKNKIFAITLMLAFILTSGFGCKISDSDKKVMMPPFTINVWRVWDGPDSFDEIIANYRKIHPNATINYRKLRFNEYEKELLDALAEDRGPDIFSVHNTWMKKYKTKLEALPPTITMVYPEMQGTLKKEEVPVSRTTKSLTLKDLKDKFVDVVYDDVVMKDFGAQGNNNFEEKIYGLPLSVDTLAMFYNKDLLNNAGIAEPPAYWNKEFQQAVKKLTKQDVKGQIIQSGVALGGSNIDRFSDILSVLMMQNGTQMTDETGNATFNRVPNTMQSQNYNPGLEALHFYTDYSNPAKEVYCWNNKLDKSLDAFAQGKVALVYGYSFNLPTIRSQSPKLNFSIAKLPQIEGSAQSINFANYWIEAVSNKSKHKNESWDFLQFASREDQVKSFLAKTKKPTALKSLVNGQVDDVDIGVFASQVLTAKSWYRGFDPDAAEKIIGEMIDDVVDGQADPDKALGLAAEKVQQTMIAPNKISN